MQLIRMIRGQDMDWLARHFGVWRIALDDSARWCAFAQKGEEIKDKKADSFSAYRPSWLLSLFEAANSFLAYRPFLLLILDEVVGGTGIEPVATAV